MRLSISPAALAHQRRLPKSLLAVPHSRQSHKPCVSAVYKYNLGISSAQLGRRATWQLVSTLRASVQDTATAEGGAAQMEEQVDPLEDFIGWLVANGVKGIGTEDSKAALYDTDTGERGVISVTDISKGETIFDVPLRLALTDHPGDEDSNRLLYEGAPWSVRLAAKLLRLASRGDASPWSPYIQVLPDHVPAPLTSFTWEELSALQYGPAQAALHEASWLATSAYRGAIEIPESIGGVDAESFEWALSVVHSRTFASAAPGGGVGVRMLVPLVDMLNHSGDEARGPAGLAGDKVATDNVRWDLIAPKSSDGGSAASGAGAGAGAGAPVPGSAGGRAGWVMRVSATRDIPAGSELMLSYGERANDDFFIHYGFVPLANPHDEAALFTDLEEALEWHYDVLGSTAVPDEAEARQLYNDALEAARVEMDQEVALMRKGGSKAGAATGGAASSGPSDPAAAAAAAGGDASLPAEVLATLTRPKVVAGGRVSGPLITGFAAVSGGDVARAEAAVALRCAQLLRAMGSSLPEDLALLVLDSSEDSQAALTDGYVPPAGSDTAYYVERLQHYSKAIAAKYPSLLKATCHTQPEAASAASSTPAPSSASASTSSSSGLNSRYAKPKALTSPAAASSPSSLQALLRQYHAESALRRGGFLTPSSSSSSSPSSDDADAGADVDADGTEAAASQQGLKQGVGSGEVVAEDFGPVPLRRSARLACQFVVYKKMLLWDLLLGCGLPEEFLMQ